MNWFWNICTDIWVGALKSERVSLRNNLNKKEVVRDEVVENLSKVIEKGAEGAKGWGDFWWNFLDSYLGYTSYRFFSTAFSHNYRIINTPGFEQLPTASPEIYAIFNQLLSANNAIMVLSLMVFSLASASVYRRYTNQNKDLVDLQNKLKSENIELKQLLAEKDQLLKKLLPQKGIEGIDEAMDVGMDEASLLETMEKIEEMEKLVEFVEKII